MITAICQDLGDSNNEVATNMFAYITAVYGPIAIVNILGICALSN